MEIQRSTNVTWSGIAEKGLERVRESFHKLIRFRIGDGRRVKFW